MKRFSPPRIAAALWFLGLAGCQPNLDDRPWLVTRPQIVGVRATPPEVRPGTAVTFEIVAIAPMDAVDRDAATWSICHASKSAVEANVVAPGCLSKETSDAVGRSVSLTIPANACERFGPDPPQPPPGDPSARPADPDATGGYYQPITIALADSREVRNPAEGSEKDSIAVALERVTCDLPEASLAAARAFQSAYHVNQNPTIAGVSLRANGRVVAPDAVPAGALVTIRISWLPGDAEAFALFDRASRSVVQARETLTAFWYVTNGELDRAASETADPAVLSADATWTSPATPGSAELAVVLRDSRGGMDAVAISLSVMEP